MGSEYCPDHSSEQRPVQSWPRAGCGHSFLLGERADSDIDSDSDSDGDIGANDLLIKTPEMPLENQTTPGFPA